MSDHVYLVNLEYVGGEKIELWATDVFRTLKSVITELKELWRQYKTEHASLAKEPIWPTRVDAQEVIMFDRGIRYTIIKQEVKP